MVDSDEVILTTRTSAIPGMGVIWTIVLGIFLKFWIGLSSARYTVWTGEGMIDLFDRIPGRRMNSDQSHQGRHLRLPNHKFDIQRIKLYQYR